MQSLIEKINSLPAKASERATFFQLKYFVIGKEPTIQAKLQSCLRELNSRKNTIESISIELEEEFDNIELLKISLEKEESEIQKRKTIRQILAKEKRIESLRKTLKGAEEEANFIIEMFEYINTLEELKDWDDFTVQEEYWNARLTQEFQSRLISGLPVDAEIMKTILALPDKTPIKSKLLGNINGKKIES